MKKRYISLIFMIVLAVGLIVVVFRNSYAVWNNTITGSSDNQMTTGYIDVKVNGTDNTISVTDPKILSDTAGIGLTAEEIFDIKISYQINKDIQYELYVIPVNENNEDVKFYLTNSDDYVFDNYKDGPKIFGELQNSYDSNGKVLYNGILSKENTIENFKLRIWLDEESVGNYDLLTYKVYIKIK